MARQGRCNAMILMLLVSFAAAAHAATHTVGGTSGWKEPGMGGTSQTYLADWVAAQKFAAGDTVVFTYSAVAHNVLTVNAAAYADCTIASPLLRSATGNDSLVLAAGANYYICGIPGHCSPGGQKVTITADGTAAITPVGSPPAVPAPPASDNNSAAGAAVSVFYVAAAVVVAAVALW